MSSPDKVDGHSPMLPQAVEAVVDLMNEDLMVKFEGMPAGNRKTPWAETGKVFTPFAEKIASLNKTLITAQAALWRTSRRVYNAGMTKDFDPVKDTLTMNLLVQICFARTLDETGETNFTSSYEATAMLTEIGIPRDALGTITRSNVVESVLKDDLKLEPAHKVNRVVGIPVLDNSSMQRVINGTDFCVVRGSIGELEILKVLPDYSFEKHMHITSRSEQNPDDPRGGVAISVRQPRVGKKERTYIRIWPDSEGIMQAEATNPHPKITIVDAVREAVLGIKLFHSYNLLDRKHQSQISALKIQDTIHPLAFAVYEYTVFYPDLAKYLIQQKAA